MKYVLIFNVSAAKCSLKDNFEDAEILDDSYAGCIQGLHNSLDHLLGAISVSDDTKQYRVTLKLDWIRDPIRWIN
ncbi:hypothetical protein ES703_22482 [subsurface metagenome]